MKLSQLFPLVACVLSVAWLAPKLPLSADQADEAGADMMKPAGAKSAPASFGAVAGDDGWLGGQTVLSRQSDGHFYADSRVDGREYRFLVDTGASVVALTGDDARDMGLFWDPSDVTLIGQGANGNVYGVPVTISQMEVGGFEARNIPAAIIPEGLHVSLLGQSFLSRIGNVEISGNEMRLGE